MESRSEALNLVFVPKVVPSDEDRARADSRSRTILIRILLGSFQVCLRHDSLRILSDFQVLMILEDSRGFCWVLQGSVGFLLIADAPATFHNRPCRTNNHAYASRADPPSPQN